MKKYFCIFILLTICSPAFAGLFGIDGTLFKQEMNRTSNEISAVKLQNQGDMAALKMQIGSISNKLDMVVNVNNTLKAQLQAQNDATAGINNSLKAGRDVTTSTTNDTGLMKKVIAGLCGIVTGILGLFSTVVTLLIKRIFTLMNNIIDDKQASKEEYKSVVLGRNGFNKTGG